MWWGDIKRGRFWIVWRWLTVLITISTLTKFHGRNKQADWESFLLYFFTCSSAHYERKNYLTLRLFEHRLIRSSNSLRVWNLIWECSYSIITTWLYPSLLRNLLSMSLMWKRFLWSICHLLVGDQGTRTNPMVVEKCSKCPKLARVFWSSYHCHLNQQDRSLERPVRTLCVLTV